MDWSYIWAVIPILWEDFFFFFWYHCTLLFGVNFCWIETFKYKQQGKEAILENNVFFYVTYEDDKMLNPANFILLCHNGSSIFLFLTLFFFGPTKGTIVHYTRPSSCVSICLLYNFILFSPWHLDLLSSLAIFVVWMVA